MFLGLVFAARSDVGLVRCNNQDSAYAGPHLLVVADGMGGAAGGDIASSIAVGTLVGLDGEALGPDEALEALKEAIARAHTDIVERAHNDPELSGLGTTVTAILRAGNAVAMAHIGDSRAYLLRDGVLDQLTTDHTFVQHLVDTGRLSAADAENHPKRSMLLRVLGDIDADIPVDISARETQVGDRWLLCTDGLSSVVGRPTLAKTLGGDPRPRRVRRPPRRARARRRGPRQRHVHRRRRRGPRPRRRQDAATGTRRRSSGRPRPPEGRRDAGPRAGQGLAGRPAPRR